MDASQIISIGIFVITFAAIMTEKLHRALAAIVGAFLLLALHILSFDQAMEHIDFKMCIRDSCGADHIGLSSFALKIVAIVGMTLNHAAYILSLIHISKAMPPRMSPSRLRLPELWD